jgi:hypothetical protein
MNPLVVAYRERVNVVDFDMKKILFLISALFALAAFTGSHPEFKVFAVKDSE